jgi:hypothetical protein
MFNDITPLLLRPGVFKDAVDIFVERYRGMAIAAVAGKHFLFSTTLYCHLIIVSVARSRRGGQSGAERRCSEIP